MLTVSDIAKKLSVSNRTVVRWIEQGKLSAFRFGKDYRIEESTFQKFLEQSKINTKD